MCTRRSAFSLIPLQIILLLATTRRLVDYSVHAQEHQVHFSDSLNVAAKQNDAQNSASIVAQNVVLGTHLIGVGEESTADFSNELHRSLRFEPPLLEFGSWPVGVAQSQQVTLINTNDNRSVYLSSVSGRTPAFYSSFFETRVVAPQGNTTFSVVFLPRASGYVLGDLLVHTSFGLARLPVSGKGSVSPYRLRPIVGVRAPLNATLTPEIHMYNPHAEPLQIIEVYSSGGQFQLELPSGGHEGPQALWEIPPYATKPVIRICFHGREAGNHTAYIRIKIASPSLRRGSVVDNGLGTSSNIYGSPEYAGEHILVVPVEFEILAAPGLYVRNPIVDFGRLTTEMVPKYGGAGVGKGPPAPLKVHLELRETHDQRSHKLLNYALQPMQPGLTFNVAESTLTLDPQSYNSTMQLDKLLLLRYVPLNRRDRNTSAESFQLEDKPAEVTLLVRADIFRGALFFDHNVTAFVTESMTATKIKDTKSGAANDERLLVVRNDFDQLLSILSVHIDDNNTSVLDLRPAYVTEAAAPVLRPGDSLDVLRLRLRDASAQFNTTLRIVTNITNYEVPLVVCTGRLHVTTHAFAGTAAELHADAPYSLELDVGAVPLREMSPSGIIALHNRQPLAVKLLDWDFQSAPGVYFHTTFLGCLRAAPLRSLLNESRLSSVDSAQFRFCSVLQPGDVAVYQVAIQPYLDESQAGALKLWTPHEQLEVAIRFSTWAGQLEVEQEQLYFHQCFPGRICEADLSLRSTFKLPLHLRDINFGFHGMRFEEDTSNADIRSSTPSSVVIAPETVTRVGRIFFEPARFCLNHCYIGDSHDGADTLELAFPPRLSHANNNRHFNELELRRRIELYRQLKWYFRSVAFSLSTHELPPFQLQLSIDVEWPRLVAGGVHALLPIEVSRPQQAVVVLTNPADHAILVDYFLADPQYAQSTQLSLPLEVVDTSSAAAASCYLTDQPVFALSAGEPRRPLLLPPHASLSLPVQFEAAVVGTYCTLLHVRSNLTLYEAVWLSARAVQSQFRFGNRKPGSATPLLFEVASSQLALACSRSSGDNVSSGSDGSVLVRRVFTARNTGEIAIRVDGFVIGGDALCSGYGFRVLDCEGFELRANESRKIEIAFRPDLTQARVARSLTLLTNLTYAVNYSLLGMLPTGGDMERCALAVVRHPLAIRPAWEGWLRRAALFLLAATFLCVLAAAHIDVSNILVSQTALYASRDRGPVHHFNLRSIAGAGITPLSESSYNDEVMKTPIPQTRLQATSLECSAGGSVFMAAPSSSNNNNNLKKRSVKQQKASASVAGATANPDEDAPPWLLGAGSPTSSSGWVGKNLQPTFSERQFRLRLAERTTGEAIPATDGDQEATVVGSRGKSPTSSSTVQLNGAAAAGGGPAGSTTGVSKKQTQRSTKKSKAVLSPATQSERRDVGVEKVEGRTGSLISTTANSEKTKPPSKIEEFLESVSKDVGKTPPPCAALESRQKMVLLKESAPINSAAIAPVFASPEPSGPKHPPPMTKSAQSPTNVTGSGSKEIKRVKPHGKTPGRERRKEAPAGVAAPGTQQHEPTGFFSSSASSSSTSSSCSSSAASLASKRKQKGGGSRAAHALNFSTPPAMAGLALSVPPKPAKGNADIGSDGVALQLLNCISSPWETSGQVSFSEVLQQAQQQQHVEQLENGDGSQAQQLNQQQSLGPIGSKKSPTSTPAILTSSSAMMAPSSSPLPWESIQLPKPRVSADSNSFFSSMATAEYAPVAPGVGDAGTVNSMPVTEHCTPQQQQASTHQQFMGVTPNGFYEFEYLLRQQQQLQQQQQQQTQQQHLLDAAAVSVNWPLNSSAWSPLGLCDSGVAVSANGSVGGGLGAWQSASGIAAAMRPPPGLEPNFHYSQLLPQQQQHQHLLHQQGMGGHLSLPLASAINHNISTSAPLNNASPGVVGAENGLQFDPFSALSSIWNENWHQQQQQQQQQQSRHNHGPNNTHNMN